MYVFLEFYYFILECFLHSNIDKKNKKYMDIFPPLVDADNLLITI